MSETINNQLIYKPCCDYHEEGSRKIDNIIFTASARAGGSVYDGKPWIYCPWCGAQTRDPVTSANLLIIPVNPDKEGSE